MTQQEAEKKLAEWLEERKRNPPPEPDWEKIHEAARRVRKAAEDRRRIIESN